MNKQIYEYVIRKESGYVMVVLRGSRSPETLKSFIEDITDIYNEYDEFNVLVDISSFGEPMKMLESWKFLYSYLRKSKLKINKCSIIENHRSIKQARFYETAARIIGFNLGVHSDLEEGKKWLLN